MAEKWNSDRKQDERTSGVGDEEIRGVAGDGDDEFEDSEDLDEEEDDEEGSTF